MNIGVIIGRFQVPFLTQGHKALIQQAQRESDALVIFILDQSIPFSVGSPLPYETREKLVRSEIRLNENKPFSFYRIYDQKYASVLQDVIDSVLVKHHGALNDFTLFTGPNHFCSENYSGKCNVKIIPKVEQRMSSKDVRNFAYNSEAVGISNVVGMVHAVTNRVPVCHNFIVHGVSQGYGSSRVLLAKTSKTMRKLILPTFEASPEFDSFVEQAGFEFRNMFPSANTLSILECTYKVDDWRLRNSEDFAQYILVRHIMPPNIEIPEDFVPVKFPAKISEFEDEYAKAITKINRGW